MSSEREQSDAGPRGVPATGAGALADMLAADPPPARQSVAFALLDERLAAPRRHVTRQEVWVEDGTFDGGHWEPLGEV